MPAPTLPTLEELGTEELSQEQRDAIQKDKEKDWDEALGKEDETPKEEDTPPKEEDEEKTGEKTDEEKAEEEKQAKEESEKKERLEKKAKELDKSVEEVEEAEEEEKAEQERLEAIAKEEGLTIEEVKENEAKDLSIADRHGKDPVKLARALRKEQSEYGKIKNELETLKEYKSQHEAHLAKIDETALNSKFEEDRELIIDKYREKFPEQDDASDDAIFERAKAKIVKVIEDNKAKRGEELQKQAEEKGENLISELPEEYKEYVPEIKKIVKECVPSQVLNKEFSVEDIALYVRGKKYTEEYVKSLEDAAYKRGSERAKIIPKVGGGKTSTKKGDTSIITNASSEDKERALQVYGRRDDLTESQKIALYIKNDKENDF